MAGSVTPSARCARLVVATVVAALAPLWSPPSAQDAAAESYLVLVREGVDPTAHAAAMNVTPTAVYTAVIRGYAFTGAAASTQGVDRDPRVEQVDADVTFQAPKRTAATVVPQPAQQPSNAVRRVGALASPTARIDGTDQRVNADIAVLDGGIQPDHPDLNVVGGTDCAPGNGWWDRDGHGTMVAGFAAAVDNAIGRVGVAPGARLWAVRVLNSEGSGSDHQVVCGLDWVAQHARTIDVANLSLGGPAKRYGPCGSRQPRPTIIQRAVCGVVARGVTVVASAGNDARDARLEEPALMPEVITVSAMADSDGRPGGLGPAFVCLPEERDDTFAFFSNFGPAVDIAAPGVCVNSTFIGSQYATDSGTSFSAPLVSGAAALYLSRHPNASPAQVRAALLARAEPARRGERHRQREQ